MNWIAEHIPAWNSWIALLLFWLPLVMCAYGYSVEFVQLYRKELQGRAKAEADEKAYYNPSLTLGWIVGHVVITIVPIFNLLAAVFDAAPKAFGDFFTWLGKALDIPLVPKRNK